MTDLSAPPPIDAASVAARLAEIRARIAAAGGSGVQVVAVTKTWGLDAVLAAVAAGCDAIGENYAQELVTKFRELHELGELGQLGELGELARDGMTGLPPVHFIGRLQTNKVRLVAPFVDVYETVDRVALAAELAKRAPGAAVLVQVSPDGDPDKGGCALRDVPSLVDTCRELSLDVRGLMTVGPTEGGPEAARPGFRAVRRLLDELGLAVCSMGMSDDLEVAVAEGSTQVRIGSALFGPRRAMR